MPIHPTALVDPKATIAESAEIGPYCVIGPDVSIGAGTRLKGHVFVEGPASIGEENIFFPYSTVGVAPQDLKYKGERSETRIGNRNSIREFAAIHRGTEGGGMVTSIGDDNLAMACVHVAHDVHVGSRADFEALDAYLDSDSWMRFQLLSGVRVVNGRYYQFATEFVRTIRDVACDLPARELLHDRPSCVCGFRLGNADGFARMFERLRMLVGQGTQHHMQTIRQFRQPILIATDKVPVSLSPQRGFPHASHPEIEVDTLGIDEPESVCKM